jgi:biopolymer transport protein ExbB/TolQ
LALLFLALGFLNLRKHPKKTDKMLKLASDVSLLGLVIGFLGAVIGLIQAFDTLEAVNDTAMMASGVKVSFLTTVFGAITFILPRIGIIILRGIQKAE